MKEKRKKKNGILCHLSAGGHEGKSGKLRRVKQVWPLNWISPRLKRESQVGGVKMIFGTKNREHAAEILGRT